MEENRTIDLDPRDQMNVLMMSNKTDCYYDWQLFKKKKKEQVDVMTLLPQSCSDLISNRSSINVWVILYKAEEEKDGRCLILQFNFFFFFSRSLNFIHSSPHSFLPLPASPLALYTPVHPLQPSLS